MSSLLLILALAQEPKPVVPEHVITQPEEVELDWSDYWGVRDWQHEA